MSNDTGSRAAGGGARTTGAPTPSTASGRDDITDTLAQRGAAYGDFREQGRITQNLKRAMQDSPNWARLPSYMKEGLDMIQHKISRMLNGDALYDDNMHDIIGYTKLMQDRAAQDREMGVVFETGGDKLYPAYEHERKRKPLDATLERLMNAPGTPGETDWRKHIGAVAHAYLKPGHTFSGDPDQIEPAAIKLGVEMGNVILKNRLYHHTELDRGYTYLGAFTLTEDN